MNARHRQEEYLSSDVHEARYRYQQGLDTLARYPDEPHHAASIFAKAEILAGAAGHQGLQLRARLRRCVLAVEVTERCADKALQVALREWLVTAPPSQAFEARFLYARNLDNLGHPEDAWEMLDGLIDDIQFYRDLLPGVLGAWYWEGRVEFFEFYMALALRDFDEPDARAERSLLAFNRLLNKSLSHQAMPSQPRAIDEPPELEELRELLARLEAGRAEDGPQVRQAIDRRLLQLKVEMQPEASQMADPELSSLLAKLPADSALLAYYLPADDSWAWFADRDGVRVVLLGNSGEIDRALIRVRSGLRVVGNRQLDEALERVGDLLLGPLPRDLPEHVYLLAAGRLAGFPFEALRQDKRYLGQDHAMVNVLSLEALRRITEPRTIANDWQRVMLAGDPLDADHGRSELPSASRELDGLRERLEGKSITSARGKDLGPGLFDEPAFANADVIHIASHAEINLEYPELSRLNVSGGGDAAGFLTPLDLRGRPVSADLVVLSACETTGINAYSFDSNLGFVSAFLGSGAGAVVATLFPVADAFAADFVLDFYAAMMEGMNIPAALAEAKRGYISNSAAGARFDWPAFQVYVN